MKRVLVLCLWLALCVSTYAQKADVTVLLDSTSVNVENIGYYTSVHYQKFILNNSNRADLANIVIGMNQNTELAKFEYVMTDLSGRVLRSVKKSELQRFEYSRELATDFYRLMAEVTPSSYPVVITRTEKIVRNGNVLDYPYFFPQKGYGITVQKAVYQIEWPEDKVTVRHKGMNIATKPSVWQVGNKKRLRYALEGMQPVARMPYALDMDERMPFVMFAPEEIRSHGSTGSMDSWTSFGSWLYGLAKDRQLLPESHLNKIRALVADCHTERAKIARLYDFLGQNTRYVAVELGIGGYQPEAAHTVMQMGFGDCKGLSNYMHSMLKAIGIESRLAAIGTDEPNLIPGFANANQLDHMILAVLLEQGKDTLWMECTNPKLPTGYVHNHISGHDALMLEADGGRIVKLPEYADSLNLRHSGISVTLRSDASADVIVNEAFHCHRYAEAFALLGKKEQEQRTTVASWYRLPNTSFGAISVSDVSRPFEVPQLNTHLEGVCTKYVNLTGRRMFVPLCPLYKDFSPMVISDTLLSQHLPMKISHGYRDSAEIRIRIPEGCSVESLPAPIDVEDEFGSFHFRVTLESQGLLVSYALDMRRGVYKPASRQHLLEMQRKILKAYNARVVFVK